jgi:hypothetical protein
MYYRVLTRTKKERKERKNLGLLKALCQNLLGRTSVRTESEYVWWHDLAFPCPCSTEYQNICYLPYSAAFILLLVTKANK